MGLSESACSAARGPEGAVHTKRIGQRSGVRYLLNIFVKTLTLQLGTTRPALMMARKAFKDIVTSRNGPPGPPPEAERDAQAARAGQTPSGLALEVSV